MTSLSDNPQHRIAVTLLDMAKHARDSAHLHEVHGDLGEAKHWAILAGFWEGRAERFAEAAVAEAARA